MRQVLLLLSILLISSACSNFHMEKRRYNKGFHISFNKKHLKKNTSRKEENVYASTDKIKGSIENKVTNQLEEIYLKPDSIRVTAAPQTKKEALIVPVTSDNSQAIPSIDVERTIKNVAETVSTELKSSIDNAKSNKKKGISGLWYFAVIGILPVFFATKRQSRNLGNWASTNVSKARVTIIGLYTLGFSSSFLLGNMWRPIMEEWMFTIPLTIAGSILVANAVKTKRKSNSVRKRMSFAAVNASSFFGSLALGAQTKLEVLQVVDPETQTGLDPASAAIISILLVILISAALLGIAAIACSLACNGYGLLALLVMVGGIFSVTFMGVWGILTVIRGRVKNRENLMIALIVSSVLALLMLIPALLIALL